MSLILNVSSKIENEAPRCLSSLYLQKNSKKIEKEIQLLPGIEPQTPCTESQYATNWATKHYISIQLYLLYLDFNTLILFSVQWIGWDCCVRVLISA